MSENQKKSVAEKLKDVARYTAATSGVILATTVAAHAEVTTADVDLTTGLAGVAVVGGIMAAGGLKAIPTYVAWGVKKALSMLR